jgi:hypothetical protein
MELSTLRQRSHAALMQKARRGELFTTVPIGFLRAPNDRVQLDPDRRIREAIAFVFRKFRELGSVRQVLLWLRQEQIELPSVLYGPEGRSVVWNLPAYHALNKILNNPVYGGAYVYGRTRTIARIEHGRKKSLKGQRVDPKDWEILIPAHHQGYIEWDEYQLNQRQIAHNATMKGVLVRGPARNGGALLAGLLRCGHCGRKLHVAYSGTKGQCLRYDCRGARVNHGTEHCISFGGLRAVQDVSLQVTPGTLTALIGPNGAGKTTLFALMSGFLKPDAGTVRFDGHDITGQPPHLNARAGMTRTFQPGVLGALPSRTAKTSGGVKFSLSGQKGQGLSARAAIAFGRCRKSCGRSERLGAKITQSFVVTSKRSMFLPFSRRTQMQTLGRPNAAPSVDMSRETMCGLAHPHRDVCDYGLESDGLRGAHMWAYRRGTLYTAGKGRAARHCR